MFHLLSHNSTSCAIFECRPNPPTPHFLPNLFLANSLPLASSSHDVNRPGRLWSEDRSYVCMHTLFFTFGINSFSDSFVCLYVLSGQSEVSFLTCAQSSIAGLLCAVKMDMLSILAKLIVFLSSTILFKQQLGSE